MTFIRPLDFQVKVTTNVHPVETVVNQKYVVSCEYKCHMVIALPMHFARLFIHTLYTRTFLELYFCYSITLYLIKLQSAHSCFTNHPVFHRSSTMFYFSCLLQLSGSVDLSRWTVQLSLESWLAVAGGLFVRTVSVEPRDTPSAL